MPVCLTSGVYGRCSAGETFRVYVLMPLLPAFEGEIGTNTGNAIQAVVHWNYSSICRGGKSLLERLILAGGLYVCVCVNSCTVVMCISDWTPDRGRLSDKKLSILTLNYIYVI